MATRYTYPGAAWVGPDQAQDACAALTFDNPAFIEAAKYGGTMGVPRFLRAWKDSMVGALWVPRMANLYGIRVEGGMREANDRPAGFVPPLMEPRDYQEAAVRAMVAAGGGVLVAPPGSGKTVMGLTVAGRINRPTLVLVHARELAQQWIDSAAKVLGVEAEIIHCPPNPALPTPTIGVVLVQALARWTDQQVIDLGADYDVLLVDEAHHSPADTWERLMWFMGCAHRFGLTATPDRKDGLTKLLHLHLGPVVYRVRQSTMVESGASVLPTVVKVEHTVSVPIEITKQVSIHPGAHGWPLRRKATPSTSAEEIYHSAASNARPVIWRGVTDEVAARAADMIAHNGWKVEARLDNYPAIIRGIKGDPERMARIVKIALRCAAEGSTLILCQHVDYAEAVAKAITEAGVECLAIHARVRPAKQRGIRLERLRSGDLKVATASTLADEFLDVKRLSRGILALPRRDKARTEQNVGRLMRAEEGKPTPIWYDIVDTIPGQDRGGPLVSQWWSRLRAYKNMGLEVRR